MEIKNEKNLIQKDIEHFMAEKTGPEIRDAVERLQTLMAYYRCAILEVETKFKVLNQQFSLMHERNPIESIKSRVKSFPSIYDKMKRKNIPVTVSNIEKNLNDIAGIRVICGFLEDIYFLADCIVQQDDVTLVNKKDYIKNPKPNGYRSLHLILEIPIFLCDEKKNIRVEVQLRTIAMESWANLEHRLRYKKSLSEEVLRESEDLLNECAELSCRLDSKMQRVRDIIEG